MLECVNAPTRGVHVRGGKAAECVPAAVLAVGRHGADDCLQVFLLLQTGRVCLGGPCIQRKHMDKPLCLVRK